MRLPSASASLTGLETHCEHGCDVVEPEGGVYGGIGILDREWNVQVAFAY